MTLFDPFKDKIASEYIDIMCYSKQKQVSLEALIGKETISAEVKAIAASGKRIGYILRACCPFTKAEIELAQQAVQTLNLDKLVFIIWPFRYVNGYDSVPLEPTTPKAQLQSWEERMEILRHGLEFVKDDKLTLLEASKAWFVQSEKLSDSKDPMNPFWTGTWFVIRKLQYFLNKLSTGNEFFYCCGADQFNPNIYPLVREGQEKIWKDYSILQQLALHHVFVVPQGEKPIQKFEVPSWSHHKVFFGTKLKNTSSPSSGPRTNKTINMMNVGCIGGVANYLVKRGLLKDQ